MTLVAENPADHHIFLSAFTDVRDLRASSSGVTASTPRGDLTIMDPTAFRQHFGTEPPDVSKGARFGALQFHLRDRSLMAESLTAGAIAHSTHMGAIIVAPAAALGATLVFG